MAKRNQSRPPKKTQTIELRVSEREKRAFLEACREAGRSASEVLRRLMGFFVIFQQLRKRYTKMIKLNFLKLASAGMATSAIVIAVGASLLFAPVVNAKVYLNYRLVVDDGIGEIVSEGSVELDEKAPFEPVADSLGDAVQYNLRAMPCTQTEHPDCSPDHVYVEIDILTHSEQFEQNKKITSLIVRKGEVARFVSTLQDGQRLTGFLEPRDDSIKQ